MKRLLLACIALASSPAIAADTVYVYKQGANTAYQCTMDRFYTETLESGSLYASNCVITATDDTAWPVFAPLVIRLSLTGKGIKVTGTCFFVSYALRGGDTWTNVDCR